ncbi:MAG: biosynthetic-type acetolactate synthase large subunit [Clostridia bacterium]
MKTIKGTNGAAAQAKRMTGAEAMHACLKLEGVSVVFGYPGAAICPFYDLLDAHKLRHILVRQEQNAGHAANGYAQASGKVGVCVVTSGPGATNLITAIATAYMDSIPLVAITGQVTTGLIGSDVFQEVDITGACEPFCKYSYLITDVKDIPRVFKEAFYIARSGRPGPVLIDIPMDVQLHELDFVWPEAVQIRGYKPNVKGNSRQIKLAAEVLSQAKTPVIVAGGGVHLAGARDQLRDLAEQCGIPVANTMMGIGVLDDDNPYKLGMIGTHGTFLANNALHKADVVLLVGARVGDRAVAKPGQLASRAKIIHIDIDPAEIGKNMEAHVPIVGDAKAILEELCTRLQPIKGNYEVMCAADEKPRLRKAVEEQEKDPNFIEPRAFVRMLSQTMKPGSIITSDVGQNQIWTANAYAVKQGRLLTSGGMGTMGFGIPSAVGAKTACPEKDVVAICGDGSFQMSMNELATIMQHDIKVKIVLMNNHNLGMVRELQNKLYHKHLSQVSLAGSPDFIKLAEAFGIHGERIEHMQDAQAAIDRMLASAGPYLLECQVDPDEPTP